MVKLLVKEEISINMEEQSQEDVLEEQKPESEPRSTNIMARIGGGINHMLSIFSVFKFIHDVYKMLFDRGDHGCNFHNTTEDNQTD